MKRSFRIRLVLMGSATAVLAGCDDPPQAAGVFASVAECVQSGAYSEAECKTALETAKKDHPKVAPRYVSREACEADFGPGKCEPPTQQQQQVVHDSGGGSFWMPLMMGYMVGKAMNGPGGMFGQPLYRGNESFAGPGTYSAGSWRTASNTPVADRTGLTTVGSGARASTPQTTTVSRGGFGSRASSVGVSGSGG